MGAGAFDIYRICENWRAWTWVATPIFATFLGSDPIVYGGTYEQRKLYDAHRPKASLTATEPEAALIWSLRTAANPVVEDGNVTVKSRATSTGSATVDSPTCILFSLKRQAVPAALSLKRTLRD
jgi:hypothetical protein